MKMKASIAILLLMSLMLVYSSLGDAASATWQAQAPSAARTCPDMCNARCAKAGIYKRCFNFCSICCNKCQCVPSGTYGNKSECPCYRDMLNSKGKPKCP